MFALSEQLTRAGKAVLDAQLASASAFAEAAFDSGVTVVDLNVDAVRTALAATTVAAGQWMAVRSPQQWFSAASAQSRLALDRASAYGRQAGDIAQGAQARLAAVAHKELAVSKQKVGELVDVVKQTPDAVATPINSFLKSAFVNVHEAYDKTTHAGHARAEAAPADTADVRQRGAN
ncbi:MULTISPECIES: phasin family protein [unclassified Janthinobacterium]|uniref:phasin family protein n=1 Tax=unclassified Janthinobacterium TaxID=2610881 RepID=UPI00034C8CCB|nr:MULTISPECIES: phasin family protein [unclassified Janthinobacterium]MEC5159895.1 phasin family protein [Janthinobacterium sp. CG_S6]